MIIRLAHIGGTSWPLVQRQISVGTSDCLREARQENGEVKEGEGRLVVGEEEGFLRRFVGEIPAMIGISVWV